MKLSKSTSPSSPDRTDRWPTSSPTRNVPVGHRAPGHDSFCASRSRVPLPSISRAASRPGHGRRPRGPGSPTWHGASSARQINRNHAAGPQDLAELLVPVAVPDTILPPPSRVLSRSLVTRAVTTEFWYAPRPAACRPSRCPRGPRPHSGPSCSNSGPGWKECSRLCTSLQTTVPTQHLHGAFRCLAARLTPS